MQVNVFYTVKWQFINAPFLKVTPCKKVINCKTSKILKSTQCGGSIGYKIAGVFIPKSKLNNFLQVIPAIEILPF